MSDLIQIDIEKIEQALNIRLDYISKQIQIDRIEQDDQEKQRNLFDNIEDLDSIRQVLYLNNLFQKNLFDLCQIVKIKEGNFRMNSIDNENIQLELDKIFPIDRFVKRDQQSIQSIRRSIAKDEKSRLTSKETTEKLIEIISNLIRQRLDKSFHQKFQSDRDLIIEQFEQVSIEWNNVIEQINQNWSSTKIEYLWKNVCYPNIKSNQYWSEDEDRQLIDLVQQFGCHADQWKNISRYFPMKSSYLCLNRYMSLENHRVNQMKLNKDQRKSLKQSFDQYRQDNYIPLNRIAYINNLSLSTVRREWRRIDPTIRRGTWTNQEDQILIRSISELNHRSNIDWKLISSQIEGRSTLKCYQRYIHLKQNLNKLPFDFDEDQRLINEHQRQRGRWKNIQRCFPNRSSYSLQNRWKKLNQFRQINILFNNQQDNIKLFLINQYSSKSNDDQTTVNNLYRQPNIVLTYKQLKCLTSSSLFIEFCRTIQSFNDLSRVGIRQLLNQLSRSTNVEQIHQWFFSLNKKTNRSR